jgi:hypothetical protein
MLNNIETKPNQKKNQEHTAHKHLNLHKNKDEITHNPLNEKKEEDATYSTLEVNIALVYRRTVSQLPLHSLLYLI